MGAPRPPFTAPMPVNPQKFALLIFGEPRYPRLPPVIQRGFSDTPRAPSIFDRREGKSGLRRSEIRLRRVKSLRGEICLRQVKFGSYEPSEIGNYFFEGWGTPQELTGLIERLVHAPCGSGRRSHFERLR